MRESDRVLLHAEVIHRDGDQLKNLKVRGDSGGADDVKVALHELPESTPLGVLAPPHLIDMIPAKGGVELLPVGGEVPRKGNGEIEAHRHIPSAVVLETVDLLVRLSATLAEKHLGVLEDRCVDGQVAVSAEPLLEPLYEGLPQALVCRQKVAKTFENPGFDYGCHGFILRPRATLLQREPSRGGGQWAPRRRFTHGGAGASRG